MSHGIKMRVKVWDLPTRVFHWLLALLAVAMVVTGKLRGDALEWHARIGYAVASLLLFRIAWGFVGGHWSRFASFLPSPRLAWAHLRGARPPAGGHNPLGAWSVYAMLLFFVLQVASGLFVQTKEDFAGPLAALVSNATSHLLTGYHKNIGQRVLIALVILHLVAIAWYALRGENLVRPMLTGGKEVDAHIPASRDDAVTRWVALGVFALCAGAVAALVKLGS
jgi:cytochrome b